MAPRTSKASAKPASKTRPVVEAALIPAKPAAKPAKAAAAAKVPAKSGPATVAFKLKDLVEAVVTVTGGKRPNVKEAVEATLASLADALSRGADLNLPPLGRIRVAKAGGKDGAPAMTLKLRLAGSAKPGNKQALADVGEDS